MIKCVLFDLDGVTIDTEPLYTNSEIRLFREYGVEIPKEDWSQARCKCCNNILATKPRLNQNKRKYAVALRQ